MGIAWASHGHRMGIAWASHGHRMGFAWASLGFPGPFASLLPYSPGAFRSAHIALRHCMDTAAHEKSQGAISAEWMRRMYYCIWPT
jgi:hypothetical protein